MYCSYMSTEDVLLAEEVTGDFLNIIYDIEPVNMISPYNTTLT